MMARAAKGVVGGVGNVRRLVLVLRPYARWALHGHGGGQDLVDLRQFVLTGRRHRVAHRCTVEPGGLCPD